MIRFTPHCPGDPKGTEGERKLNGAHQNPWSFEIPILGNIDQPPFVPAA